MINLLDDKAVFDRFKAIYNSMIEKETTENINNIPLLVPEINNNFELPKSSLKRSDSSNMELELDNNEQVQNDQSSSKEKEKGKEKEIINTAYMGSKPTYQRVIGYCNELKMIYRTKSTMLADVKLIFDNEHNDVFLFSFSQ